MSQPELNKNYRQFLLKNDPKTMLQLPKELMSDLKVVAEFNQREVKEEIVSRLIATLQHNDDLMQKDRLHQLIFNRKLAVDEASVGGKSISTKNKKKK